MRHLLLSLVIMLVPVTTLAHEYVVGDLFIYHPHSHPTQPQATSAEGYTALTNYGREPERLIGVRAGFAQASLRSGPTDENETPTAPLDAIAIAPGETVVLQPGGLHILFDGLDAPFTIGGRFDVTLVFERAGTVTLEFWVEGRAVSDFAARADEPAAVSPTAPVTSEGSANERASIGEALRVGMGSNLRVETIVLVDDAAVAGWQSGEDGGRVFLRKAADGWEIRLISGRSLATPAGLRAQGLSPATARQLHTALQDAEAALAPNARAMLDRFAGTILVEPASR